MTQAPAIAAIPDAERPAEVSRRAVFYVGGYDPKSAEAFFERLDREGARSAETWGVDLASEGLTPVGNHLTRRSYTLTTGTGHVCKTDFHFIGLDDIVLADFERPFLVRLGRYLVTSADYVFSGTGFRIFRHAWRFGLYFLYPFMALLATLAASLALGALALSTGVALSWLAAPLFFLATFSAIVQMPWRKYFVLHLMDLWSFSRDFLHGGRADIETKLDDVAGRVLSTLEDADYDECLFVGHSTGGALILDAAGRVWERTAEGTEFAPHMSVLTVGSTALKIGLHPAAQRFRDRVKALVADPRFHWAEYQCLTDIINFYRTRPGVLMGADDPDKPVVRPVRVRDMVSRETYTRIRRNFFRVHYQFVFGNSQRYHYDFPIFCFGPRPLDAQADKHKALKSGHISETA